MEGLVEVSGAVAYVSDAGARFLQECWRANPTNLRVLCGVEEATQGKALRRFLEVSEANSTEFGVAFAWTAPSSGRFHPKMWLFIAHDECRLLVGSANLTAGGHQSNIECGVLLHLEPVHALCAQARATFASWWKNSAPLQLRLADAAKQRDEDRQSEKAKAPTDAIGRAWNDAVEAGQSDEKSVPLPPLAFEVEQQVLALLGRGVVVELTASARDLYEKFEGDPFEISGAQKVSTEVLRIEQRDSQMFCVLSAQTKKSLDASQKGAREALKRYSYASPWGAYVPYLAFEPWHRKQADKRSRYKAEIEQQFQSEAFWQQERARLRGQIERESRATWEQLHQRRPKMPEKNLKQVIYEVQRAFDRRHGELRSSVALHYQARALNWSEMLRGIEGAPPEVARLLQAHARNQHELLLRDWMHCLIRRTRTDAQTIEDLNATSGSKNYKRAELLSQMNFFDDVYLRAFVHRVQGTSLFNETNGDVERGQTQTLQSWHERFENDLNRINNWHSMSFADVLSDFASITGWTTSI